MNLLVPLLPDDLVGSFEPSYCDDMVRSCIIRAQRVIATVQAALTMHDIDDKCS